MSEGYIETLYTIFATHQAPLSMGFSRQEYWSRLPFPTPGDLPNPQIKPGSLASPALAGGFFTTSAEIIYLRLGLEPTWLGLKPSRNLVWDLNPAKTHSTWFQVIMKLRFLMSHCRKNSVRDKVIGKKWIYSDIESSTLQRVWAIAEGKLGHEIWCVSFL